MMMMVRNQLTPREKEFSLAVVDLDLPRFGFSKCSTRAAMLFRSLALSV
jgi:hypothetical protein